MPARCLLALAALTAIASPALADDLSSRRDAIINGERCGPETHPTTVGIILDGELGTGRGTMPLRAAQCTGTLIAPDVVLAAAHCVDSRILPYVMYGATIEREDYYVSFTDDLTDVGGENGGPLPDDAIKARDWVWGTGWHPNNFAGDVSGPGNFKDIALIFLDEPVTHVQPMLLITAEEAAQLAEGREVEISGYGQTRPARNQWDQPPSGEKVCGTSFIGDLGTHEMQIGGDQSSTRKCHGDSGGPTYFDVATEFTNKRRVIGITSHAYDESDCAKGGVDTRVDAWLEWIDAQMRAGCKLDKRAWCEVEGIIPPEFYEPEPEPAPVDPGGGGDVRRGGCQGCAQSGTTLLALLALPLLRRARRR